MSAETLCFPFAAQATRLTRQHRGRKDETVALITSASPETLNPAQWLLDNRLYWGIEGVHHQRLDASLHDDLCRVRNPNGVWVLGMFRRLANSLFFHWQSHQPKPKQKTMTDFHAVMGEENLAKALRFVTSKHSKL